MNYTLYIISYQGVFMLNKVKLTKEEMLEYAKAFADYNYGNDEIGMIPLYPGFPDKTKLIKYLLAIIKTANEYNGIYATDNKEGIIIITDTTKSYPFKIIFKMIIRMIKALGFRNFKKMMKKFQSGGASLEKKYRDEKKQFVQIELLAIKTEYQGQGFMRPLVETAFEIAKEKNLPVIVTTDASIKKDKYAHIGMNHINTRKVGDKTFLYDLERRMV